MSITDQQYMNIKHQLHEIQSQSLNLAPRSKQNSVITMEHASAPVTQIRIPEEKFEFKEIDIDYDYVNNTVVHRRNTSNFVPYLRERDDIGCIVAHDDNRAVMGKAKSSNVSELSLKDKIEMAASKKRKDPMKLTTQ